MKKYKFLAENTTYYSLEVEAPNLEEARKIAEESDGSEWNEDGCGRWEMEDQPIEIEKGK